MARAQGARAQMALANLLRIIATPTGPAARRTWRAELEDGRVLCEQSRQPLLDAARALIGLGHNPGTLVTLRHAGKAFDSFRSVPLSVVAQLTAVERDGASVCFEKWRPHPKQAATVPREVAEIAVGDVPAILLPAELGARPAATPRARGASGDI